MDNLVANPAATIVDITIENFQQRRHFARMLHLSERYQEASELREELMRTMDEHLRKMKK